MCNRKNQNNLEERLMEQETAKADQMALGDSEWPLCIEKMRVLDMHAHLLCLEEENKKRLSEEEQMALGLEELELRRKYGVATFFSCGTPEEWAVLERLLTERDEENEVERRTSKPPLQLHRVFSGGKEGCSCLAERKAYSSGIFRSFGIHPWYSDQYDPAEFRALYEQCDAVGEIGMDSVWCDIPLETQRECFVKQLEIATKLKKPVILHTKGQEAEIAELVRDFPGKICVHWYSGDEESFERFLEMGCYFTLGPDVHLRCAQEQMIESSTINDILSMEEASSKLYQRMLREIPEDHLFVETDGISAVAWARGVYHLPLREIPAVLEENLEFAAKVKGLRSFELSQRMFRNLRLFLEN